MLSHDNQQKLRANSKQCWHVLAKFSFCHSQLCFALSQEPSEGLNFKKKTMTKMDKDTLKTTFNVFFHYY